MSKKRRRSFLSRHPRLKRVVYSFYGVLFVLLIIMPVPLFILPKKWVYSITKRLSRILILPSIKEKVCINLKYAYGKRMTDYRANAIAKKCAANVMWSIVDCYYLWLFKWFYNYNKIVVKTVGLEYIFEAAKQKKGLFVATAHYGCFEVMPAYFINVYNISGSVIARSFPSPVLTWLNRKARMLHNIPTFYDDARGILRTLRSEGIVGILPDFRAKRRLGLQTTFFGKPTLTFGIHVILAGKTGSPIIPAFLVRHVRKPWQYTFMTYPSITVDKKIDEKAILRKVQEVNDVLENHIRQYPSGWIWFHNKWKLW